MLITFDDGLLSQYEIALPILEKHKIKAIFFVATAALELSDDEAQRTFALKNIHFGRANARGENRFMLREQVRDLAARGQTVGSHTVSHCKFFGRTDEERIRAELRESANVIDALTGQSTKYFAYPKGDVTSANSIAVDESIERYAMSFFAVRGCNSINTPHWCMMRDPIHPYFSVATIKSYLRGDLDWYYRSRITQVMKIGGGPT